ncbi:hypothetical protein FQR65_LT03005 [Abscondita terminalis]|nr:hypothetical protein FQR65_LT03005 [Abscondita terminalis]
MEQLYMLEVFLQKIRFAPQIVHIPNLEELKFRIVFAHLINLDIELNDIRGFKPDYDPFRKNIKLDIGKSVIFSCKPVDLLSALLENPLRLELKTKFVMGLVDITWTPSFIEMVDSTKSNAPATFGGTFDIFGQDEEKVASVDLFVRLSLQGQTIQTDFQVVAQNNVLDDGGPINKYFFANTDASTLFKAQTVGGNDKNSQEIPLIAAICGLADSKTLLQDSIKPEDLSMETINEVLCNNKSCPGAQKFAKFGIGPAATGTGMGTLYDINESTEIPMWYGISNTYGSMENYGPFGLYVKPTVCDESSSVCSDESVDLSFKCLSLKLKGENEENDKILSKQLINNDFLESDNNSPIKSQSESNTTGFRQSDKNYNSIPLRLKGGGPENDDNGMPQPMMMCKDLMQSFDKVLEAYKKALGPCGQGTCPFAYNVIDDSCKKFCQGSTNSSLKDSTSNNNAISACGTPSCPFSRPPSLPVERSFQQTQIKSACGKSTCPYTRQKLGSCDEEDTIETQFLDGRGQPCDLMCPQTVHVTPLKPLDPIHWDCPDPLPKGPCRNPQCPLKPMELRYKPTGPCGGPSCPYAAPNPCSDPSCPFVPPCSISCRPPSSGAPPSCTPSPCCPPLCPPFSCTLPPCPPPCSHPCSPIIRCCENVTCPANPPACVDPACPLNPPPKQCPAMLNCLQQPCPPPPCILPSPDNVCSNPNCPLNQPQSDSSSVCENPDCPLNKKSSSSSLCSNPACPLRQKGDGESLCSNPDCPLRQVNKNKSLCLNPQTPIKQLSGKGDNGSVCSNPQCPFNKLRVCSNPDCPNAKESVCSNSQSAFPKPSARSNPDCPANAKESICLNPQCPFRKPSVCSNPDCPNAKESICSNPQCPFRKPSVCSNPECPFRKPSICSNPDCPNAKESICSNPQCPFRKPSICSNPECPFRKASVCSNPDCPFQKNEDVCSNPDCPFAPGPSLCCSNPDCPFKAALTKTRGEHPCKVAKRLFENKRKIRKSKKFKYKLGDLYPGMHIGHRECILPGKNVPAKMGWAWNVYVPCVGLKPRRGWRPGAVSRKVANMIIAHRRARGLELLEPLTIPKKKKNRYDGKSDSETDVTIAPKSTLQVKKKDGAYLITMNPLKDPNNIKENESPYMDCSPLQFKITKNKDESKDDSRMCFCDEEQESSSDSELDIEFTPPAGIIRPERFKKQKDMTNADTQYDVGDFGPPKGESSSGKPRKGKRKK